MQVIWVKNLRIERVGILIDWLNLLDMENHKIGRYKTQSGLIYKT